MYLQQNHNRKSITLAEMNVDIINRYINWRIQVKRNTPEGVNKTLAPLYKAVAYEHDIGEMDVKTANTICTNYLETKSRKYTSDVDDKEVRYLTDEQVGRFLELYDRVKYDTTRKIMDIFLFSLYTCGLRFSDLLTLEWRHIDFGERVNTQKHLQEQNYP